MKCYETFTEKPKPIKYMIGETALPARPIYKTPIAEKKTLDFLTACVSGGGCGLGLAVETGGTQSHEKG